MKKFIPFIIILAFFSCKPVPEKIAILEPVVEKPAFDTQQSIAKALEAFSYYPDLPVADSFKLKRTLLLKEGNEPIQLHLSIAMDKKSREHQMVTIINAQNEGYSIPLFPNDYSNYWNFEFLGVSAKKTACHTTFEKEFYNAFDFLQLNDTLRSSGYAAGNVFYTLLDGFSIGRTDDRIYITSIFKNMAKGNRRCLDRLNKSMDSILEGMLYLDPGIVKNASWDERNCRIYQLFSYGEDGDPNPRRGEKEKIVIKVFKADC
jgi:hypothetical protein